MLAVVEIGIARQCKSLELGSYEFQSDTNTYYIVLNLWQIGSNKCAGPDTQTILPCQNSNSTANREIVKQGTENFSY